MGQSDKATFGHELRKAREQHGLTVTKVSDATKVSEKHIRALEAGDFEELPGGVFRRGFVRSYIKAVGLEEGRWMQHFEHACHESGLDASEHSDWTKFAENVKSNRASHPGPAARRTGWGLLLVVLALAGWCGWRLMTHRNLLPLPLAVIHFALDVMPSSSR
jgi:cytoskeleton protein RodZ